MAESAAALTRISMEPLGIEGLVGTPSKPSATPLGGSRTPGLSDIEVVEDPALEVGKSAQGPQGATEPGPASIEQIISPETSALSKVDTAIQDATAFEKEKEARGFQAKTLLAAAKFGLDVMNAQSAYGAIQGAAQLNILEARRQGFDALERGKQRDLEAQVEGQIVGEQTVLALAAQGQDISSAGVEKARSSVQDIGIYNGLQEEMDSIREALGFDLEEVAINYQVDLADIERQATILSSGLNLGANIAAQSL